MNLRAKGQRPQRKAVKYLEDLGYIVHQFGHSRWKKDCFNLFDAIAVRKIKPEVFDEDGNDITERYISAMSLAFPIEDILWIQIKTNTKPSLKPFQKFKDTYGVNIWIMIWIDRKGWNIIKI